MVHPSLRLAPAGYHAFVLEYRIGSECEYPNGLEDVGLAMLYLREHAQEWHLDPDRIILCGLSSGGELAAGMGVKWCDPATQRLCGLSGAGESDTTLRPCATVLCYPVSGAEESADSDMQRLFRGSRTQKELAELTDVMRWTTPAAAPAFIWHTWTDGLVPMEHSLNVARALAANDVPFELHIYGSGPHGSALCTPATAMGDNDRVSAHNAGWFALCLDWLRERFGDPMEPMAQAPIPGEEPRAHMGREIQQLTTHVTL